MTPDQIGQMQMTQAAVNDKSLMQRLSAMFLPQGVEKTLWAQAQVVVASSAEAEAVVSVTHLRWAA